jgi:hypothetical protein
VKRINSIPTYSGSTGTYRNDIGILYNNAHYTIHENNVDYANLPTPATNAANLGPIYWIKDAPVAGSSTITSTYQFGLMIRTKRITTPAGNVTVGGVGEFAQIFFDGTVTNAVAQTTLIEGEYVINTIGVAGANTANIAYSNQSTTGLVYVKNIVLVNATTGGNALSFRSNLANVQIIMYSFILANRPENNVTVALLATGNTVDARIK